MKVYQVVYSVNGRTDDRILEGDSISEVRMMIKMDYPNAVIKSVKVVG